MVRSEKSNVLHLQLAVRISQSVSPNPRFVRKSRTFQLRHLRPVSIQQYPWKYPRRISYFSDFLISFAAFERQWFSLLLPLPLPLGGLRSVEPTPIELQEQASRLGEQS